MQNQKNGSMKMLPFLGLFTGCTAGFRRTAYLFHIPGIRFFRQEIDRKCQQRKKRGGKIHG